MAICCAISLSDDSEDQALQALADLSAAGSRHSYGTSASYSSYGGNAGQFQPGPVPVPVSSSYGYGQPQVILPKPPKANKSWTKKIFKSSDKGATSSYPSYVISPYGPPYRPPTGEAYSSRYGNYPNGYNNGYSGAYGSSFGTSYGSPYVAPYGSSSLAPVGASFGPGFPVQPPLVGSSLYGSPDYLSPYSSLAFGGNLGGLYGVGASYGLGAGSLGGYQSYTPTLVGAFDNYRGPIYYGGFRPTLGPYGGKPYSDLLSVTDSYGQPIFPYPSF